MSQILSSRSGVRSKAVLFVGLKVEEAEDL